MSRHRSELVNLRGHKMQFKRPLHQTIKLNISLCFFFQSHLLLVGLNEISSTLNSDFSSSWMEDCWFCQRHRSRGFGERMMTSASSALSIQGNGSSGAEAGEADAAAYTLAWRRTAGATPSGTKGVFILCTIRKVLFAKRDFIDFISAFRWLFPHCKYQN